MPLKYVNEEKSDWNARGSSATSLRRSLRAFLCGSSRALEARGVAAAERANVARRAGANQSFVPRASFHGMSLISTSNTLGCGRVCEELLSTHASSRSFITLDFFNHGVASCARAAPSLTR